MNELERQVMEFALQGEHPALAILREQLEVAAVSTRKYTGVGFLTSFVVPTNTRRLPSARRLIIHDVFAEILGLQYGAGFLVFVEHGVLDTLECAVFEDAWPTQASIRRLYYMQPKEPGSPSLVEAAQRDITFAFAGPGD